MIWTVIIINIDIIVIILCIFFSFWNVVSRECTCNLLHRSWFWFLLHRMTNFEVITFKSMSYQLFDTKIWIVSIWFWHLETFIRMEFHVFDSQLANLMKNRNISWINKLDNPEENIGATMELVNISVAFGFENQIRFWMIPFCINWLRGISMSKFYRQTARRIILNDMNNNEKGFFFNFSYSLSK